MISTKEIRKGLYFNVPRKDQCPFRIDLIEHLSDTYAKVGMSSGIYKVGEIEMEGHPLTWELKDLDPIPLNEEWLLKMGFEKSNTFSPISYKKRRHKAAFWIRKWKTEDYFRFDRYYSNAPIVKYVHQLQNLYFALTGEELTINEK
jgi:hypothetical protein